MSFPDSEYFLPAVDSCQYDCVQKPVWKPGADCHHCAGDYSYSGGNTGGGCFLPDFGQTEAQRVKTGAGVGGKEE